MKVRNMCTNNVLTMSFFFSLACGFSSIAKDLPFDRTENAYLGKVKVQLSIAIHTNCVPALTPILLRSIVENETTNNIELMMADKFADCLFTIIGENGKSVPKTRYGERVAMRARHSEGRSFRIPPGGRHVFTIPVNLLYDMSNVEEYSIKASVQVRMDEGKTARPIDIESCVLQVRVLGIDPLVESMWDER